MNNQTEQKTTKLAFCRDCSQGGVYFANGPGFALYVDDDGEERWWYCLYCGSNHVDLKDSEGHTVYSEGDLYAEET